jgi:type VI secretion system secreted protein Hcp
MDALLMKMTPHIPGASKLRGYEQQIELLSFSHSVAMQITGDVSQSERTSGRPNHQDFTVTKYLDQASPRMNEACSMGTPFGEVKITVGRNDGDAVVPLITYTLKNVIISSVSIGGGGGDMPVETLTMNYGHITWDFRAGKEANVRASWDLASNKAG